MQNGKANVAAVATGAMAEMVSIFFKQLVEQGFTRDEAMQLTQVHLETAMTRAVSRPQNQK
ncbi:MAG: hypothetical protein FWE08_03725 [Oscillospiraceae bacterium]|nr:hypothetical protein [Oscillospiraceae bacterium]